MEEFLLSYGRPFGYLAVFLGSLVEGESIVLTAGFLAYKGFFSLPAIIVITFTGSLLADQTLFFVGRRYGPGFIERRPKWRAASKRVFDHLHRHNVLFILSFRFIYGFRVVTPIIIGASGVAIKRFAILNFIAAAIWSVLSCYAGYMLGYFFADTISDFLANMNVYQRYIIGILVAVIAVLFLLFFAMRKLKRRSGK